MDSDCFHRDPSRHRTKLFQALNGLTSPEFGQLLYCLQPPAGLIPDSEAPQMKRVKALLDWAEGSTGRGTDEIWDSLAQLQQGSLSSQGQALPNFQPYLQAITTHTQYGKWWEHYTLTDVEGKVKPPKPEQPSVFDFGLMVQTVAKDKDSPELAPDSRSEHREKIERLPVLEGIRKYADGHVLLVGRPGSGKSTALIRLLLEEASSFTAKPPDALTPSPSPKVGRGGQEKIPVLVELRYWQGSIEGLIQGFLKRHGLMLDDAALSAQLGEGRFLLLVDGLNELPTEEARTQLSAFRRNYPHGPMIFTTRDLGLGGDLGIEKKLEMQPLTETQMKAFIRAYVPNQAEAMLRQLNHRLRDFGQTPLLLWMLCEVFQQSPNQQLPNNLAEVFRAFTTMYEDSSVRKHEVALLKGDVRPLSDRRLWKPALMALAALMMQGETLVDFRVAIHRTEAERELGKIFAKEKFPVRDILDDLLKYHLLQNRTTDQLEFRHQLIQEYYAAEHLLRLLPELSDEQLKRDYLNYLKWTEPIVLMLALVGDDNQAVRVVKLAMDDVDLLLGVRLAGKVKIKIQKMTVSWVALKKMSLTSKALLLENTYSEFAIAELLALPTSDEDERSTIYFHIGEIGGEAAIQPLSRALDDEYFPIRLDATTALGNIGGKSAIPALIKALDDIDVDVRERAAQKLSEIGSKDEIEILLDKCNKEQEGEVIFYIILALHKFGYEDCIQLAKKCIQEDRLSDLCLQILPLYFKSKKENIRGIQENLSHKNSKKIEFNINSNISSELEINTLVEGLKNSIPQIRCRSAVLLGELGFCPAAKEISGMLIHDTEPEVRQCAAEALGKIVSKSLAMDVVETKAILTTLEKALNDSNASVRYSVVEALEVINHDDAILGLMHATDDISFRVCARSVSALTKIGNPTLLPQLWEIFLNDKEECKAVSKARVIDAVVGIQNRCKFYNYEIWQAAVTAQKTVKEPQEPKNLPASNVFPNATEVKIIERVEHYYEKPPSLD